MKNLRIMVNRPMSYNPIFVADGKKLRIEKFEDGKYGCDYSTESDTVSLEIFRYLEINGALWWLFSLFFFFISCFGIFDVKYDKRCICIRYRANVVLGENNNEITVSFNKLAPNTIAVDVTGTCSADAFINEYYVDEDAKKRLKKLKLIKLFLWLALVAVLIFVLVKVVMGF